MASKFQEPGHGVARYKHRTDLTWLPGPDLELARQNERAPKRIDWIDSAKGLAIALVVFGHVVGGALARDWLQNADAWKSIYDYIYLFHMPLFFMVSGLFCVEAMRKSPSRALLSALGSVAWPYVLWDVVCIQALLPFMGALMLSGTNVSWAEWLTKAATGNLHWFLWTLFVTQLILIPIARVPLWILFGLSLIAFQLGDLERFGSLYHVASYLPYLLVGAMLHAVRDRLNITRGWGPALTGCAVFALLVIALALGWTEYKMIRVACGIAGSLALMVLVQCMGRSIAARLLAELGVASLVIYLFHPYFLGAARAILSRTIGSHTVLQVALVTPIAIVGPFVIWLAAERFNAAWLFRLKLARSPRTQPELVTR